MGDSENMMKINKKEAEYGPYWIMLYQICNYQQSNIFTILLSGLTGDSEATEMTRLERHAISSDQFRCEKSVDMTGSDVVTEEPKESCAADLRGSQIRLTSFIGSPVTRDQYYKPFRNHLRYYCLGYILMHYLRYLAFHHLGTLATVWPDGYIFLCNIWPFTTILILSHSKKLVKIR